MRNESKAIHPYEEFSDEAIMWQECQQAVLEVKFNSQIWKKTDLPGHGVHLALCQRTEGGRAQVWKRVELRSVCSRLRNSLSFIAL